MTYLESYYSRLNHYGNTTGERIVNQGIRTFQRWKNESPHTVPALSVERGIYFDGVILQSKDKAYQKIMHLNVSNDIPLIVGDIMNWTQRDGDVEKWLLLSEEKKVNGTYRTFDIIKCNYLIKWVDAQGHLQQSWSYVLSSTDDKVKGNYRTWHNLISPQPNKYAEITMPYHPVDRGTNFIIEDEGWKMIEADFTSVKGIIYMSLTENKVNFIYDDLVQDIADTDKIAKYRIDYLPSDEHFMLGAEIKPTFTLFKNGIPVNMNIKWDTDNTKVIKIIDNVPKAIGSGTATLIPTIEEAHISLDGIQVIIDDAETEFSAYIKGEDSIRLDRYSVYQLVSSYTIIQKNVQFSLEMLYTQEEIDNHVTLDINKYATVYYDEEKDSWVIHANDKNNLHALTLKAVYDGHEFTKVINIVPLW